MARLYRAPFDIYFLSWLMTKPAAWIRRPRKSGRPLTLSPDLWSLVAMQSLISVATQANFLKIVNLATASNDNKTSSFSGFLMGIELAVSIFFCRLSDTSLVLRTGLEAWCGHRQWDSRSFASNKQRVANFKHTPQIRIPPVPLYTATYVRSS